MRFLVGGNSDKDKKEFLYDISSFANTSGGHLIFGVKENNGVPTEICGLDIPDADAVILQLENKIRDGIAPRIPGIAAQAISLSNNRIVIVFRIPRSFSQPHMITFKNASKFYARNSAGKYQMDVGELRTAFTLSQNTVERIRSFRHQRLDMILSVETPINMNPGAKIVLHVIPIGAFDFAYNFDITSLEKSKQFPFPFSGTGGWEYRYNFDGLLITWQSQLSYTQTFRNGIIEVVDAFMLGSRDNDRSNSIPSVKYETKVVNKLSEYILIQKMLGVEPPFFIMLSLLGVKGYLMSPPTGSMVFPGYGHPIDRDNLMMPEVMVENCDFEPSKVMKPIFDAVWNACGYPRSLNYNDSGN